MRHGEQVTFRQRCLKRLDRFVKSLLVLVATVLPGAPAEAELDTLLERKVGRGQARAVPAALEEPQVQTPPPAEVSQPASTYREEADQLLASNYLEDQAKRRFLTHWRTRRL